MFKFLFVTSLLLKTINSGSNSDRFNNFVALTDDLKNKAFEEISSAAPFATSGSIFSIESIADQSQSSRIIKKRILRLSRELKPSAEPSIKNTEASSIAWKFENAQLKKPLIKIRFDKPTKPSSLDK